MSIIDTHRTPNLELLIICRPSDIVVEIEVNTDLHASFVFDQEAGTNEGDVLNDFANEDPVFGWL